MCVYTLYNYICVCIYVYIYYISSDFFQAAGMAFLIMYFSRRALKHVDSHPGPFLRMETYLPGSRLRSGVDQGLSNLGVQQNHLESLLKHRWLEATPECKCRMGPENLHL